jgi:nitrogen-specific signal transduction histidine kinase
MGGKMEVESRQGTTTFRVILPLVKEEGSPRE